MKLYKPECLFTENGTSKIRTPYFDVGEFLPTEDNGFHEIARICLASTTGDVISIRAKECNGSIIIEVVDEYLTEFFEYKKDYSEIPTQGEICDIITTMCLEPNSLSYLFGIIEMNGFSTINEITDFIYMDSNVYPDLNELFVAFLKQNEYK